MTRTLLVLAVVLGGCGSDTATHLRFGRIECILTTASESNITIGDGTGPALVIIPAHSPAGKYVAQNLDWISTSGAFEFTTGANTFCKIMSDFK